jgi:class 3 adenylate cyclase/tetratricopeptide (TPR) repeat protein
MAGTPTIRCLDCRHENPARAKFCLECGQRLARPCAACGAELPDAAKFCLECGRPVAPSGAAPSTGALAPAPETRTPAAYTPRHLAEKILTSRGAIEGERKPVTVLFCDLVDSTALAERLGPEGMHALLNSFFEAALAEVHHYEGTVNQFLGDGFMALFGAPLAREDHARRATLAALGVARALRERPIAAATGVEIRLTVRMGLHTGFVVVGAIGDNLRMDYTAVGDTTHLAARLQQLAEPGAILASEATWRLVQGYIQGERVGPVRVKGRSQPVVVFRLLGVGSRRSPLEEPGTRGLSRFVGRDRELETLLDLFAAAAEGRGQVMGVVGEPGVGKSRLLLEFRRRLAGRPVTYVQGRCLSYGATIPYVPVADILRAHCGLADTDAPESVAERLRAGLQAAGMDPDAGLPYLLHMLGGKDPAGRIEALGPEVIKVRTFETLRQMCLRGSRRQPLVLEIEDLHWVDRTSEEYFGFLAESLFGAAILLVATYRPGYRPPWSERSFATQLSLGRLPADESLVIVQSLLPTADSAHPVAQLILDKAEGNPFFLEELARAVSDEGLEAGLPVPDTVHGVLTARIDRLAEEPKRLLQTASILGREFAPRLLGAIWDGPGPIEPHLRELARLEFLFERPAGDEVTYVFKHALTQDVAEATLLPSRRRELHRRAGEALERLHPERLAELAPRLAHHYGQAEAWAPAAEHARRAAEAARAVFANREALARYDQAIDAAQRAALPPADRLVLLEGRGDVHGVHGDFETARADHEAALGLTKEPPSPLAEARGLGALAALWGGHKDYERGLALSRDAVAAAERAGDTPDARRVAAEARLRVGLMELNLARLGSSRPELERALESFRQAGDQGGEGRALDALAMVAALAGDLDTSVAHAQAALPRLIAAGDRQTEASCLSNLAFVLFFRGRRAEGEAWLPKALAAARAIGARAQEAYVHSATAEFVEPYGDWGLAMQEASTGLAIARALGHREWTVAALGTLGRLHRSCGDVAGARRLHEEMLTIARDLRTTLWIADAVGEAGQDFVAGGAADGVRRLGEAVELAGEAVKFAMRPLLALADLALDQGRPGEALDAARRLQRILAQYAAFATEARRAEGQALFALGQVAEGEGVLRRAKAEAAELGAAPVGWRASLALARLLGATGRADDARAARADARRLLDKVAAGLTGVPELLRGFQASPAYREAIAP